MRTIKLPDLLIETDNDLHYTDPFLPVSRRAERNPDDVCNVLTLQRHFSEMSPETPLISLFLPLTMVQIGEIKSPFGS